MTMLFSDIEVPYILGISLFVCLSEMLDVLIVGAGPHALILATLLLNPQQHVSSSNAEILQGIQLSKTNSKTGWTKSKRRSVGMFNHHTVILA